jgi:hypothetical protein
VVPNCTWSFAQVAYIFKPIGEQIVEGTKVKSRIFGVALLIFAFFLNSQSHAFTIDFSPSVETTYVGGAVRIDVLVNGFVPNQSPAIGDFDIYVRFNASVLSSTIEQLPTDVVFGNSLGIPGQETTAIWGVYEDTAIDIVRIAEFSGLTVPTLQLLQNTTSFLLGSLYFNAIAEGVSFIEFTSASIGGGAIGSSAVVTVAPVPEPETYVLLLAGLGLVGVAAKRRRRYFGAS